MRSVPLLFVAAALFCACGSPQTEVPAGDAPDEDVGSAESDGASDGSAADGDPSGGPGEVCETLQVSVVPTDPEILVVLDRSGSMAGEAWDQAILAIDKLIAAFPQYKFGLSMYPAVGEELDCKAGKMDVAPAFETLSSIHDALYSPDAAVEVDIGYTPTAKTLRAAEPYLTQQLDSFQDRFVLLVTDGQPNCNAAGPFNYTPDLEATLDVLADLAEQRVPTFVFGYRTQSIATTMDQMAAAGSTGTHHAVEDETTILAAFTALGDSLAACTFELDAAAPGAEFVRVLVDGEDVELDADGFTLSGDSVIQLQGATCATVRDGGVHLVEASVECEPIRVL